MPCVWSLKRRYLVRLSLERALLILLILIYGVMGVLFAARTPDWQVPDEPAHYNYVAQVATNGCCPVLEVGDWNSVYLDNLKGVRFAPDTLGDLPTVQYEDHQPPLYYLLASLVFRVTNGSLLALRLFSLLLGAGVVAGAYATGKALLPEHPQIALGAAALVAFVPQHLAMLAAVQNDSLAELIVAWMLWGIITYLKTTRIKAWQLGVLVGLGLLTKISTIFLAGLVPLAILVKWWIERRAQAGVGRLVREWLLFGLPALVLGALWWLRNLSVYGFPDVFGLGRHNIVVADQLRTADLIAQVGTSEYLRRGVQTTFDSFWGQFGWMALPLPDALYTLIGIGLLLAGIGLLIGLVRRLPSMPDRASQWAAWGMIALTAVLALAQYLYYNAEFVQFQGRYMYPGLIPLGLWVALGLDGWRRLIFGGSGQGVRAYAGVALIALLIPLDLYIVWRVIPGLAP